MNRKKENLLQSSAPIPEKKDLDETVLKNKKVEEIFYAFKQDVFVIDEIETNLYTFINFLLYKTYKNEFYFKDFKVNNVFCFSDSFLSKSIELIQNNSLNCILPINKILLYNCLYEDSEFDVILDFIIDQYGRRVYQFKYKMKNIDNNNSDGGKTIEFRNFIFKTAYKKCPFKNRILKINYDDRDEDSDEINQILKDIKIIEKNKLQAKKIEKIYVPEFIKSEIKRFMVSIEKNISPLRFIFSGNPGTAKTEILKYIVSYLDGKCTVILVNSGEHRLNAIFNLANYLSPCLIYIDDIDFIARDRESYFNSKTLASFIQKLDEFLDLESVSILATTNDKRLIDIAAKRPGRFDQIIDVNEIDSKNYIDLIKDQLEDDEQLLEYFTDNIISDFKKKKVTGSFIVNLIKQLKIYIKTIDIIDKEYIEKFIKNSYLGFYDSQIEEEIKKFGFIEEN